MRMADVAMHEQAIGIDDDGRAIPRDPSGADPVSVDTCAVLRDPHPPASSPADLARLTCEQDLRSFNASRGWLGAPTHYSGQRDVGTGVIHDHGTARALFAGLGRRTRPRPIYGVSAGWTTTSLASGTCPPADVALLKTLCTGVDEPCVIACVTLELRGNAKVSI